MSVVFAPMRENVSCVRKLTQLTFYRYGRTQLIFYHFSGIRSETPLHENKYNYSSITIHNSKIMGNECSSEGSDTGEPSSNHHTPHSHLKFSNSNQSQTYYQQPNARENDTFFSPPPSTLLPITTTHHACSASSSLIASHTTHPTSIDTLPTQHIYKGNIFKSTNDMSLTHASNGPSSLVASYTTKPTSLNIDNLPAQRICKGNVFKQRGDLTLAVNLYHQNIKKQCRIHAMNMYCVKFICIEKYHFLRAGRKNKPLKEADHLCKAAHISRRRQQADGEYYYLVTDTIPHTCDSSTVASTPRSRNHNLTTKQMSSSIMGFVKQDQFHVARHIGHFVETEFHMPPQSLCYQQRHRVRSQARKEYFGSTNWQYATLVSRLELIKKYDPESLILLKVFADNLPASLSSENNEDSSLISDLTSQDGKSSNTFCLRFGAIAVTPGAAVRRHALNDYSSINYMKLNCSMDACHLSTDERGCLTDIIQPLPGDELLVDTFTVDAQNECRDAWNLALTCDRKALGRSSKYSFCGDRLKGQDAVNAYVYPDLGFTKCHFHIKDNIRTNGGTMLDTEFFQSLAYSLTDNGRKKKKNSYMRSRSRTAKMKDYFKKSILPEKDKWAVYDMKGEKEGLFSCQLSESFHEVMKASNIRSSPLAYIPELIIKYEYAKIHRLQHKYQTSTLASNHLSKRLHEVIKSRTQPARHFEIETINSTATLSAKVTYKYDTERFTHLITLSVIPPTCSYGCLRLLGQPCREMCTFAASVDVQLERIIPHKYTIKGCHELLTTSLHPLKSTLEINIESLQMIKTPQILPPHVRKTKGRPHSRRMRKGDRHKKFCRLPASTQKCANCGKTGHNKTTCLNATDGQGNYMDVNVQDRYINQGFLVIPIEFPGNTILPKSIDEFDKMRNASIYPVVPFHKHVSCHHVCEIQFGTDNCLIPENAPEDKNQEVHLVSGNFNIGLLSPEERTSPSALPKSPQYASKESEDPSSGDSSKSSSDENSVLLKDNEEDEDGSIFSFPDDISQYTLDINGKLSLSQKKIERRRSKGKSKRHSFMSVNVPPTHTKEKIMVGDIISYVPSIYVQAHPRTTFHSTQATVLAVDPRAKSGKKVELSSNDMLKDDHNVRRIKVLKQGRLVSHPGCLRQISSFVLTSQTKFSGSSLSVSLNNTLTIVTRSKKNLIEKTPKKYKGLVGALVNENLPRKRKNH